MDLELVGLGPNVILKFRFGPSQTAQNFTSFAILKDINHSSNIFCKPVQPFLFFILGWRFETLQFFLSGQVLYQCIQRFILE